MPAEVFFYQAADGECDVDEFLAQLPLRARAKCTSYMERLEDPGPPLSRAYAAHVRGRIWELRPEWGGTEYRLLYAALRGNRFVVLTAFKKSRPRLREEDIVRAEERLADTDRRLDREEPGPIRPRTDR